jgi:hypothetical protein
MTTDLDFAALSFVQPLFQHRSVCIVAEEMEAKVVATYLSSHGAKATQTVLPTDLPTHPPQSAELVYCSLQDTRADLVAAVAKIRAPGGVVVWRHSGDAALATQALTHVFPSIERAAVMTALATWVGPPGALTATVAAEQARESGSVLICAERPQRLAMGCVRMSETTPVHPAHTAPSSAKEVSFLGDLEASLDRDRLREVETRLADTLQDLVQAQVTAAQALAERDHLKRKLERASEGTPLVREAHDAAVMAELKKELETIEALVKRLPQSLSHVS